MDVHFFYFTGDKIGYFFFRNTWIYCIDPRPVFVYYENTNRIHSLEVKIHSTNPDIPLRVVRNF